MKRNILFILVPLAFLVSIAFAAHVHHAPVDKEYARCTGSSPCNACSNCSACKYCSGGGTCGKCRNLKAGSSSRPKETKKESDASTGQCKATTKKGTRCSRTARAGGYCWQHGG